MDHTYCINKITEKATKYHQPLYTAFANYENAFYSVEIPALTKAVRNKLVQEA